MAKFKGIKSLPEDARYRWGTRGEIDVFDENVQHFVRIEEGDELKREGDGYVVVKKDADGNEAPKGVITSDKVATK